MSVIDFNSPIAVVRNFWLSRTITLAVQVWLRSQLTQVEDLNVQILGDRGSDDLSMQQLLSGQIPQIVLTARRVVYQGLHLSQVHLSSTKMQLNLAQIFQGQPLQLRSPVPARVELVLQADDFNASHSSLLQESLTVILLDWLWSHSDQLRLMPELNPLKQRAQLQIHNLKLDLKPQRVIFNADLNLAEQLYRLTIHACVVANLNELQLESHQCWIQTSNKALDLALLPHAIQLGPQIAIQHLELREDQFVCQGQIMILP